MAEKRSFTTKFIILLAILCVAAGVYLLRYRQTCGLCNTCGINVVAGEPAPTETSTDRTWAQPLEIDGVNNFHRVSDGLYRGAQPTDEGFRNLKDIGIATVLNLRKFHSDRKYTNRYELGYEHITFNPLHPEDKEVVAFLRILADPANKPIFVHCQYGSDRTGMMCAVYRVAVQGWTKDEAIAEWTEGDFGFHESCRGLVDYFRRIDLEEFKRQASLQ